ncbi:MAG: NAD(P)/FAD-dependent oxidoreductase [Planctomycetota bacterium]|nr:NAD(P)/FAD-dependent oxidoreductase [Planctomycetota bacterium]MDA1179902.1 NAD(P)/FAD-dependent oxidoreductase [Planctomycetota bacterium]
MNQNPWDVIVIGAGAAGLLAATRSAERGRRTLLLEKNRKPGVKILISGGTRCNLTHDTDVAGMMKEFGSAGKFLQTALHALTPQQVVEYVEAEGVLTKVEETGKVFPVSDRALDIQRALSARLARTPCAVHFEQPVLKVDKQDEMFFVRTASDCWQSHRVIVTTGGCSYPGCGTTGDGYAWLGAFGHTIVPPRPALVPLICEVPWARGLSGMTLPNVCARIILRDKWEATADEESRCHLVRRHALSERTGALLFTHFGLSGPVALDVSRAVTSLATAESALLVVDFLPQQAYEQTVSGLMSHETGTGGQTLARYLSAWMPQRLLMTLLDLQQLDRDQRCAELGRSAARKLAAALHFCPFPIHGTRGFAKAEVTAGGVDLKGIHPGTLESKRVAGLFVAGEILDIDGPIGGYNFQAAFSTGWLAGSHA